MTPLDLGLRFVVEPHAAVLSESEKDQLAALKPSGVMFRKRNFLQDAPYDEWLDCYKELLNDVRTAVGRKNLFVTIDHEGGRVHRFPDPITRFPYPAFYSASEEAVEHVARAMALELRSLGINVSFSPVADIHSNPHNPVINQRAFGRTPEEVCPRISKFAQVLSDNGVTPCAKHFPGHGDTGTDSHFALPVIHKSLDELLGCELRPFIQLIGDSIPMVMSAHLMVPQLDATAPATLSRTIMKTILREQLGFTGVTVADALGMQAIKNQVDSESFGAMATRAELDLLLYVGDPVSILDALKCKEELCRNLSMDAFLEESATNCERRITALLHQMPCYEVAHIANSILREHAHLRDSLPSTEEWGAFELHLPGYD